MNHHGVSFRTNLAVYLTLMILLAVTYGAAKTDLGRFNTAASLLIAATKAILVALYFMHLRSQRGVVRIAAISGVFWLAMLMALALSDFTSRNWLPLPGPWPATAAERAR